MFQDIFSEKTWKIQGIFIPEEISEFYWDSEN